MNCHYRRWFHRSNRPAQRLQISSILSKCAISEERFHGNSVRSVLSEKSFFLSAVEQINVPERDILRDHRDKFPGKLWSIVDEPRRVAPVD
jgi:hypothetical protein